MIAPGSTIGILGGGQLGRMLALAAAGMGYRVHILAPEAELVAGEVAADVTRADYTDRAALDAFAARIDVATYEFENIDIGAVRYLSERCRVRPGARALEIAQDRLAEKRFVATLGGHPAPYRAVSSLADLHAAAAELGCPAVLKTRGGGYDGKGQARLRSPDDCAAAWEAVGGHPAILEAHIDFACEFSVLLARGDDGATEVYACPRNAHEGGILAESFVPGGPVVARHAPAAVELARAVGDALDYAGVLTLEFFATDAGPVFNEMAPRVHNSGHWTIEGARASQFENHIRAVCGLPLGSPAPTAARIRMKNLIGDAVHDWPRLVADPQAHLHLYGKGEARPGRKMGHVTWLGE